MKKIVTLLCALVMSIAIFTGCNVIVRDDYKYYHKVVASIGDHDFLMKDLLQAYNSYGSTYVEEQGMSLEEAIKKTVDDMIDRHLLVEEIVSTGLVDIEAYEQDLLREVYAYMDSQIDEYEAEVRVDWDMEITVNEDATATDEDGLTKYQRVARTEFESKYEVDDTNGWTVTRKATEIECDTTPAPTKWEQKITDSKVSAEARKRFISDLRQSAKAMGLKNKTDEELLQDEMDRVYKIYRQNKVISVYQAQFTNNLAVDADLVVEKYKELFKADYEKYKQLNSNSTNADKTRLSAYHSAMGSDAGSTYYHVEDTYVEVAHILLKADDTTTNKLAQYKAKYEAEGNTEYTEAQYNADCKNAINQNLQTIYYTDANGNECKATLNEVLNMIDSYVNTGSSDGYKKSDRFLEMMYRFNDDEGIMNKAVGYAIPMYTNDEVKDTMVASFANGSRELASEMPEGGNMKTVYSEYGIHIIYNMGVFSNDGRTYGNIENVTAKYLWEHRASAMSEKSLFELVSESLAEASASEELTNLIEQAHIKLKNKGIKIDLYTSRYDDLWK